MQRPKSRLQLYALRYQRYFHFGHFPMDTVGCGPVLKGTKMLQAHCTVFSSRGQKGVCGNKMKISENGVMNLHVWIVGFFVVLVNSKWSKLLFDMD